MHKIIEVDSKQEGLYKFLGERVTLYCGVYIYTGKLAGVNENVVMLTEAEIVYDTGSFSTKNWSTSEKFPRNEWYIMTHAIESFGLLK